MHYCHSFDITTVDRKKLAAADQSARLRDDDQTAEAGFDGVYEAVAVANP